MCEVLLNIKRAQAYVESELGFPVARGTFYNWRRALNLLDPRLTLDELRAIKIFGEYITEYRDAEFAKLETIKKLKEKGL